MVKSLLILAALLFCGNAFADEASVRRGAYIANIGDCTSCHTAPGLGYFAGGLPLQAPFGTIFSTNITPDPTYGIGSYSRADFLRVMREGVTKDGHHLYPAMPYASFSAMSDNDLNDLYDYLMQGVAPVSYQPPKTQLIFPFNQRWGMALWDAVFARHKRFTPDTAHDAEWNRGAYLVQGAGHCGACHTPRGFAYEEKGYDQSSPYYLSGGFADNWATANLTAQMGSGLGRWSENDIASFLKTGHGNGSAAFGNMKEAVEKSTQYLNNEDLKAIAHYLKSFPPKPEKIAYTPEKASEQKAIAAAESGARELPGAGIYASACSSCHGAEGQGKLPRIPALASNSAVLTKNPASIIRILLEGSMSPDTVTGPHPVHMPSFGHLTDREIAELATYVRTSWGNDAPTVSEYDVSTLRHHLEEAQQNKATETEKANSQKTSP